MNREKRTRQLGRKQRLSSDAVKFGIAPQSTAGAHTMNERLRIGREIKQALDDIIPKERRLSDAQIAKEIGVSQQMVTRIELLALYKIRQKFKELLAREAGIRDSTDFGIHDVETLNSVAA